MGIKTIMVVCSLAIFLYIAITEILILNYYPALLSFGAAFYAFMFLMSEVGRYRNG